MAAKVRHDPVGLCQKQRFLHPARGLDLFARHLGIAVKLAAKCGDI
jgi:hypothetical protein